MLYEKEVTEKLFVGRDKSTENLKKGFVNRLRNHAKLKIREIEIRRKLLIIKETWIYKDSQYVVIEKQTEKGKRSFDVYKIVIEKVDFGIQEKIGKWIDVKMNVKQLEGRPASTGVAIGKVKLILSQEDCKRFKKGDIAVIKDAEALNIDREIFYYIIKNAKAVVADDGGLVSSVAIVSREFGTPCVVATGNATKILKNGDVVKVDGTKGIVYL
jgi:phosphoenolpyruvate synthase/pyruvate phosphate dikinase